MLSKQYSHAAPYIRHQLVQAVYRLKTARLKRDQTRSAGEAFGLARALLILARSSDQTPVVGIADEESLPPGGLAWAREWVGLDEEAIFGDKTPRASESYEPVSVPQIPALLPPT